MSFALRSFTSFAVCGAGHIDNHFDTTLRIFPFQSWTPLPILSALTARMRFNAGKR